MSDRKEFRDLATPEEAREAIASLGLGFVPVGTERVRVLANPERTGKASVRALDAQLDEVEELTAGLDGFAP